MAVIDTKSPSSSPLGAIGLFQAVDTATDSLTRPKPLPRTNIARGFSDEEPVVGANAKRPSVDFSKTNQANEKDNIDIYTLFMLTRTDEQKAELDGASNEQFFSAIKDFVNSVPALRDMQVTGPDGSKITLGEKLSAVATQYEGDTSRDRSTIRDGLAGLGSTHLDNNLRYSGSPLLHSSLKVLRESSDYGGRHTGIKGASTFHKGIDLAAGIGTDIRAGTNAEVAFVGHNVRGYGNVVILNHGSGVLTLYGHLSSADVRAGQNLRAGEKFADSGNTGVSGGAHIHFETIVYNEKNGKWTTVDPNLVLAGQVNLNTAQGRAHAIDLTESRHGRNENGLVSRMAEGVISGPAPNYV